MPRISRRKQLRTWNGSPDHGNAEEKAQAIAVHESPRTTKLYDRTRDEISLDEIERIAI